MVADGRPNPDVNGWAVEHIVLPRSHKDYGNTPRSLGSISALNLGYDAVAFLDADNWFAPDHVESLVAACRNTGAPVSISERVIVVGSGQELPEDLTEGSAAAHIDTSTLLVTAGAAFLLPVWAMMDRSLTVVGDRVFAGVMQIKRVPIARTGRRTLFYHSDWASDYEALGLPVPAGAKRIAPGQAGAGYDEVRNTARLGFPLNLRFEARG
jgi:hypothetical protein